MSAPKELRAAEARLRDVADVVEQWPGQLHRLHEGDVAALRLGADALDREATAREGPVPVVLTHTEARELLEHFRDMETERHVPGYGDVGIGCDQNVRNDGGHRKVPRCLVERWIERLEEVLR